MYFGEIFVGEQILAISFDIYDLDYINIFVKSNKIQVWKFNQEDPLKTICIDENEAILAVFSKDGKFSASMNTKNVISLFSISRAQTLKV